MVPSLVCLADILGFSDLTMDAIKSGKGDAFLRHIRLSLSRIYNRMRKQQKQIRWFEMKVFTDNIVVAFPLPAVEHDGGEPELMMMFQVFADLQCTLALDGFFVRGAIAYGSHYMDEDMAIGDALIEAHSFGDQKGGPPRLVIAPSVERLMTTYVPWYGNRRPPHLGLLLQDPNDGQLFLNYLTEGLAAFPDGGLFHDLFAGHRNQVAFNLLKYRDVVDVREKYEWIANYHNFVCDDFASRHPVSDSENSDEVTEAANYEAQQLRNYLVDFRRPPESMAPPQILSERFDLDGDELRGFLG